MKKKASVILLAVIIIAIMILSLLEVINSQLGMSIALGIVVVFNGIVAYIGFKNDVKFMGWLMSVLAVFGLVLTIINVRSYLTNGINDNYKFQIIVENNNSPKTFMFTHDGYNYYTYNLSSVKTILRSDGKTYDLKNALEEKIITLDEILSLAVPNDNTGGYKIYYDGGQSKYENDEYSIVVCENGKKDIIFSTYDYVYDNICK